MKDSAAQVQVVQYVIGTTLPHGSSMTNNNKYAKSLC